MAKTVADLDASLANLATALQALATAIANLPAPVSTDLAAEVTGVDNATAQVQAAVTKLTPAA